MSKPLVATVSHELGRRKAKDRIEASLDEIRSYLSAFATSVEEQWTEDRLDFRLIALGQAISGRIDVFEESVRIEVILPGMLGFLGAKISRRIREHGLKLLVSK
jgi:hypothetical protein